MNDFRASVRRFMDAEVLPYLDEWERAGELPRDLHDKAGQWVCDQALQLHGGLGYMREAEVERQYRDQKILAIGGGTTEILTGLAAERLGFGT